MRRGRSAHVFVGDERNDVHAQQQARELGQRELERRVGHRGRRPRRVAGGALPVDANEDEVEVRARERAAHEVAVVEEALELALIHRERAGEIAVVGGHLPEVGIVRVDALDRLMEVLEQRRDARALPPLCMNGTMMSGRLVG